MKVLTKILSIVCALVVLLTVAAVALGYFGVYDFFGKLDEALTGESIYIYLFYGAGGLLALAAALNIIFSLLPARKTIGVGYDVDDSAVNAEGNRKPLPLDHKYIREVAHKAARYIDGLNFISYSISLNETDYCIELNVSLGKHANATELLAEFKRELVSGFGEKGISIPNFRMHYADVSVLLPSGSKAAASQNYANEPNAVNKVNADVQPADVQAQEVADTAVESQKLDERLEDIIAQIDKSSDKDELTSEERKELMGYRRRAHDAEVERQLSRIQDLQSEKLPYTTPRYNIEIIRRIDYLIERLTNNDGY
ncbi:MAG: hypothetical protein LBS99_02885 [Clostridiales bacterium]|jgi:hypothetical protein|nr:hypothetical protein [Clostridiales bacterium]